MVEGSAFLRLLTSNKVSLLTTIPKPKVVTEAVHKQAKCCKMQTQARKDKH